MDELTNEDFEAKLSALFEQYQTEGGRDLAQAVETALFLIPGESFVMYEADYSEDSNEVMVSVEHVSNPDHMMTILSNLEQDSLVNLAKAYEQTPEAQKVAMVTVASDTTSTESERQNLTEAILQEDVLELAGKSEDGKTDLYFRDTCVKVAQKTRDNTYTAKIAGFLSYVLDTAHIRISDDNNAEALNSALLRYATNPETTKAIVDFACDFQEHPYLLNKGLSLDVDTIKGYEYSLEVISRYLQQGLSKEAELNRALDVLAAASWQVRRKNEPQEYLDLKMTEVCSSLGLN